MRPAWSPVLIAVLGLGAGLVAPGAARPAPAGAAGIQAPGYRTRYLVGPNPLQQTDGMALDGHGGLFVTQALSDRIVRLDLATGALTRIADERDADAVHVPDDVTLGPDGNLYVTAMFDRAVVRMTPD